MREHDPGVVVTDVSHVGENHPMPPAPNDDLRWIVLVPVKRLAHAKTRLSTRTAQERSSLALAFARDVVVAAVATPSVNEVIVITDDSVVAAAARECGARVVEDAPDAGLNPALAHGALIARRTDTTSGLVVLAGDLPALRPEDLTIVLQQAAAHPGRSFVADVAGIGTTALAARPGHELDPEFGGRSRAAHRASGAHELMSPDIASVRRDVDTEVDLWDAIRIGVGAATTAVLAH